MNKCSFISNRYLKGKNSSLASSHWLSLLGIIIGVSALLIILSVMNGMRNVVIERTLSSSPEIELILKQDDDYQQISQELKDFPFIRYFNPVYEENLVILHNNHTILTKFIGINLEEFKKNSDLLNKLPYTNKIQKRPGLFYGSNNQNLFYDNGIFIGYELSRKYGLQVGDHITTISLNKSEFSSFGQIPLTDTFIIQGIYTKMIPELEHSNVYIADINLQKMTKSKILYNKIEIYSNNFSLANSFKQEIAKKFTNNDVYSWSDKNNNLYNAQKLEKNVMTFILGLIILLSSFNLTGSFLKKLSNKKKEIGILSALGYSKKDLIKIFFNQGLIIGLLGVVAGNAIAIILLTLQLKFNLIPIPSNISYLFPCLPISIEISDFIFVSIYTLIFAVISSLFPIYRLNTLNPIDLIKE